MIRLIGSTCFLFCLLAVHSIGGTSTTAAQSPEIPETLEPWKGWVLWGNDELKSPPVYNNPKDRIQFWPSELSLSADAQSARWKVSLHSFAKTWVPLPGSARNWPRDVKLNGATIVVVERAGRPSVKVDEGQHELSGEFAWDTMPQSIQIPAETC